MPNTDFGYRFCPRCGGALAWKVLKESEPQRLVCQACAFVFYLDPKVAACTICMVDGGIVLLRRTIEPRIGTWVFPGGFVDRGEAVSAAAIRETSRSRTCASASPASSTSTRSPGARWPWSSTRRRSSAALVRG
jgi:hypothetical protein